MDYRDYKNTREIVWNILIKNGICSLPIRISDICKREGIIIKRCDPELRTDGLSTIVSGIPHIYYSDRCTIGRQRFTVAHELGHIILGHVGKYRLVNREPSPSDNPIEQSANVFASRLLAPACVLWGCGVRSSDDIMKMCGISKTSAEYRMERMTELYKRNKFLLSPLEQRVYAQFKEYINNYNAESDSRVD